MIDCPVCGRVLISQEGSVRKLKTRIVIFLHGKTLAKCRYCKHDVEVPIHLDEEAGNTLKIINE